MVNTKKKINPCYFMYFFKFHLHNLRN